MKKFEKINKKIVITILGFVCIFGVGMVVGAQTAGEAGSVNDPLVTKSYLDSRLENVSPGGTASSEYKKVVLSKGKVLVGKEGTEIMVYSGNAVAYSTADGIVNVTVGELAKDGVTLGKYSVYVVPDNESGVKAGSDVVLFVRGDYSSN